VTHSSHANAGSSCGGQCPSVMAKVMERAVNASVSTGIRPNPTPDSDRGSASGPLIDEEEVVGAEAIFDQPRSLRNNRSNDCEESRGGS